MITGKLTVMNVFETILIITLISTINLSLQVVTEFLKII